MGRLKIDHKADLMLLTVIALVGYVNSDTFETPRKTGRVFVKTDPFTNGFLVSLLFKCSPCCAWSRL